MQENPIFCIFLEFMIVYISIPIFITKNIYETDILNAYLYAKTSYRNLRMSRMTLYRMICRYYLCDKYFPSCNE